MIAAVYGYLESKLVGAGIPANRIAQEAKDGGTRKMPYAEITTEAEGLRRDGTKSGRTFDEVTKQATVTTRLFRRELPVTVKIVHRGLPELSDLTDLFLIALERGFTAGNDFIRIEPVGANWADDPALLKNRAEVELRIICSGGLYQETTGGTIQQVKPPTVTHK